VNENLVNFNRIIRRLQPLQEPWNSTALYIQLLLIINASVPWSWKEAKLTLIHKKGLLIEAFLCKTLYIRLKKGEMQAADVSTLAHLRVCVCVTLSVSVCLPGMCQL